MNTKEQDRWSTVRISKPFLEALKSVYQCRENIPKQQITLILIGAVFARLSSILFYGSNDESVFFFRLMAAGCLNTAEELENPLSDPWVLNTWKSQLADTQRCAEQLSGAIIRAGRLNAPDIASLVIPAIW